MYFTEMHALNSIKLPYPTDNATITPIQNNVLFTGLNDLLIFDGKNQGTLWPLNTSFQADLKPVLWSGFYYLLAADETERKTGVQIRLRKMTCSTLWKKWKKIPRLSESRVRVCRVEKEKIYLSGLIDIAGKEWKITSHDNRLDIRMLPANVYVLYYRWKWDALPGVFCENVKILLKL